MYLKCTKNVLDILTSTRRCLKIIYIFAAKSHWPPKLSSQIMLPSNNDGCRVACRKSAVSLTNTNGTSKESTGQVVQLVLNLSIKCNCIQLNAARLTRAMNCVGVIRQDVLIGPSDCNTCSFVCALTLDLSR